MESQKGLKGPPQKDRPKKRPKKPPAKVERTAEKALSYFKLVVAYQGTHYSGWQKQSAERDLAPTIQDLLQTAAAKVLRNARVVIHASGRTDAGVHARAQVAHMRAEADLPPATLIKAINAHLPDDIRVLRLESCAADFHAQLHVKSKTYRYFILHTNTGKDPVHWPFLRPYTWFVSYRLDYDAMRAALATFHGTHDFKAFQNRGTPIENTVRELTTCELIVHEGDAREVPPWMPGAEFEAKLLEIRVSGSGFLKQMVRNIVGTTVEVGRGRIPVADVRKMIDSRDRRTSGITAPAHGLFLDRVEY